MVICDRCHRKFDSYTALLQHYKVLHSNVTNLAQLESRATAEKENASIYRATTQFRGPSRMKILAFVLLVVIGAGVIGYVAFAQKQTTVAGTAIAVGKPAPDFSLPVVGSGGGTFKLSDMRGRWNVLLFFNEGLACQPCLQQMAAFEEVSQDLRNLDVVVVSITGDRMDLLASWVGSSRIQYGKVLSDETLQVSRAYDMLGADVSMMPGTAPGHSFVLVNKSGMVVWRQDYGPSNMWVPNSEVLAQVRRALQS